MRKPFVTDRIVKLAKKIKAKVILEPEYEFVGHITFANGKTTIFRDTAFNINALGSVQIAKDKGYASYFLRQFGFKVPDWQTVFSKRLNENIKIKRNIDDGYKLAKQIGFPVIVKPNDKSKGEGVFKVHNKTEYYTAAKQILNENKVMLIQEFCEGRDFRIVVLDGVVISAYERTALTITGDGKSNIYQLLQKLQATFEVIGRDTVIDFADLRLKQNLKRLKLSFNSIIKEGRELKLLDNANLSSGGSAFDFTDSIHPDFKKLAADITSKMCLKLCGVDILTPDISKPIKEYNIIEINAAPGLDNYAFIGKKQNKRVDELYLKILRTLEAD
jgi:D-alanine-D-alanine ligase-like ATP-grasp enzyme